MRPWPRCLLAAAALAAFTLAAATAARAETWNLALKRLEPRSRSEVSLSADSIYRTTYAQRFTAQVGPAGKSRIMFSGASEQSAAFKRIAKQEPKYRSEYPFRGVAKLGSQQYAFALDAVPPPSEAKGAESQAKDEKSAAEEAKSKDKKATSKDKKAPSDSAKDKAKDKPGEASPPKAVAYNRLYFDFNRNGDLTDDKVLEAESPPRTSSYSSSSPSAYTYAYFQFPRVDVTIDADGTPVDYAFLLGGYARASRDYSYAGVSLNAAAYREGEIVLEGKKRHVVLLDFNSNGRFDDEIKLRTDIVSSTGRLYPEQGDMLLMDLDPSKPALGSAYDVTSGGNRQYVSKLVNIDGRYYDLKISASGDKLTLNSSSVPLGSVTSPNDGLRALLCGDLGFLTMNGSKDTPTALPAGRWKLLSYTIDQTGYEESASSIPAVKKADEILSAMAKALASTTAANVRGVRPPIMTTRISAAGTKDCPAVEVRKGEALALPFGPPYKPVVKVSSIAAGKEISLSMSLIGSAGEVCTGLTINGSQPSPPEFTITDPKGEVVERGKFKYG